MNRIFIFGVRRSGLHVVSDWVCAQFPNAVFFNNANVNALPSFDDAVTSVVLFEDAHPSDMIRALVSTNGFAWRGTWCALMVVRDPFNLFASRVRHYRLLSAKKRYINNAIACHHWLPYAKRYNALHVFEPYIVRVSYNRFVKREETRRTLSRRVSGTFTDRTLLNVNVNGNGSSFDGLRFNGTAQQMKVFNRWEELKSVRSFHELFTQEIVGEASTAFPEETEAWKGSTL